MGSKILFAGMLNSFCKRAIEYDYKAGCPTGLKELMNL